MIIFEIIKNTDNLICSCKIKDNFFNLTEFEYLYWIEFRRQQTVQVKQKKLLVGPETLMFYVT